MHYFYFWYHNGRVNVFVIECLRDETVCNIAM